jgi:hypothetical protein
MHSLHDSLPMMGVTNRRVVMRAAAQERAAHAPMTVAVLCLSSLSSHSLHVDSSHGASAYHNDVLSLSSEVFTSQ